jgi:hypothetical protein
MRCVAGDAGIVDQDVDEPELGLDLFQAGRAGLEGRHVPLVDRDAGLGLELLRRLVIAAVIGRHHAARPFQGFRDRGPDAARSTCHHRNSCHATPSLRSFLCAPAGHSPGPLVKCRR